MPPIVDCSSIHRHRCYALIAIAFFVAALASAAGKALWLGQPIDLVVSDGRFYYVYLSSFVIDGDLDFRNQIIEHWGPDFRPEFLEDRTPSGHITNIYPIGLALTILPGFLAG